MVTVGARTGLSRTTEIWFTNIGGRIVICGTPSPDGRGRHWLANLMAIPDFEFCLKESLSAVLTARAVTSLASADKRTFWSAPETRWYRERGYSLQELVSDGPMVEVIFTGDFVALNTC